MAKVVCESCGTSYKYETVKEMVSCPVCGEPLWSQEDQDNEIFTHDEELSFGDGIELGENDSFDEDKIDLWWYNIIEPGQVWEGITFKNGKVITGECVVVKGNNFKDIDLNNKILICEVTTAKDVKYIKDIKALIVDNGGVLCHAAIFSREFNIPCLMGCEVATKYFNTKDIVTFDLDNEIIKKVDSI